MRVAPRGWRKIGVNLWGFGIYFRYDQIFNQPGSDAKACPRGSCGTHVLICPIQERDAFAVLSVKALAVLAIRRVRMCTLFLVLCCGKSRPLFGVMSRTGAGTRTPAHFPSRCG